VDLNQLTYDGYTLKENEGVLAVDEQNLPNTNIYRVENGALVPHPDYQTFAHQGFGTVRVTVKTGAGSARWDIIMAGGVETAVARNDALDRDELLNALRALDEKYLTSRVLANLAAGGDEFAQAQWEAHEAEAAPLRARLEELENNEEPQ
jgi:hypothetical protein